MQILKAYALSVEGESTKVFIYLLFTFIQNQLQVLTLCPWQDEVAHRDVRITAA